MKVLNPIGYKLETSGSLRFCEVAVKGVPYGDVGGSFGGSRGSRGGQQGHGVFGSAGGGGGAGKMSEKHVWWLVNASTRQTIAAYYDARTGVLKEMTLPKCIEVKRRANFVVGFCDGPRVQWEENLRTNIRRRQYRVFIEVAPLL